MKATNNPDNPILKQHYVDIEMCRKLINSLSTTLFMLMLLYLNRLPSKGYKSICLEDFL